MYKDGIWYGSPLKVALKKKEKEMDGSQISIQDSKTALAKSLGLPSIDYIVDVQPSQGKGVSIASNVETKRGTLILTGNSFRNYPLILRDTTPISPDKLVENLLVLLTDTPLPKTLDRKNLNLKKVFVENEFMRLGLSDARITLLKWCAELLKESGTKLHWLPIIQDLIWLDWGWKKPAQKPKKKKASLKTHRRGFVQPPVGDHPEDAGDHLARAIRQNIDFVVPRVPQEWGVHVFGDVVIGEDPRHPADDEQVNEWLD